MVDSFSARGGKIVKKIVVSVEHLESLVWVGFWFVDVESIYTTARLFVSASKAK